MYQCFLQKRKAMEAVKPVMERLWKECPTTDPRAKQSNDVWAKDFCDERWDITLFYLRSAIGGPDAVNEHARLRDAALASQRVAHSQGRGRDYRKLVDERWSVRRELEALASLQERFSNHFSRWKHFEVEGASLRSRMFGAGRGERKRQEEWEEAGEGLLYHRDFQDLYHPDFNDWTDPAQARAMMLKHFNAYERLLEVRKELLELEKARLTRSIEVRRLLPAESTKVSALEEEEEELETEILGHAPRASSFERDEEDVVGSRHP